MLDVLGRAKRSRKGIADSLENTEGFEGVTGTISFSRESHVPLKTVWVIEVHNAEKILAQAFIPDSVPPPVLDKPGARARRRPSAVSLAILYANRHLGDGG